MLDVQLTALYDPRGAVDVALETEAGPSLPFVTRPLLHQVLAHLLERRYSWLRLARDGAARTSFDGRAFEVELDGRSTRLADASDVEERLWSWVVASQVEA